MDNGRSGFTLLELIIYMAGLAVVMVLIVGIFVSLNNGRGRAQAQTEVNSNLRFAIDKIESDLRSASAVSVPSNVPTYAAIQQIEVASSTMASGLSTTTFQVATTPGELVVVSYTAALIGVTIG